MARYAENLLQHGILSPWVSPQSGNLGYPVDAIGDCERLKTPIGYITREEFTKSYLKEYSPSLSHVIPGSCAMYMCPPFSFERWKNGEFRKPQQQEPKMSRLADLTIEDLEGAEEMNARRRSPLLVRGAIILSPVTWVNRRNKKEKGKVTPTDCYDLYYKLPLAECMKNKLVNEKGEGTVKIAFDRKHKVMLVRPVKEGEEGGYKISRPNEGNAQYIQGALRIKGILAMKEAAQRESESTWVGGALAIALADDLWGKE